MYNHIHLILQCEGGKLSDLISDYKKFTANNILEAIRVNPESRSVYFIPTEIYNEILNLKLIFILNKSK